MFAAWSSGGAHSRKPRPNRGSKYSNACNDGVAQPKRRREGGFDRVDRLFSSEVLSLQHAHPRASGGRREERREGKRREEEEGKAKRDERRETKEERGGRSEERREKRGKRRDKGNEEKRNILS